VPRSGNAISSIDPLGPEIAIPTYFGRTPHMRNVLPRQPLDPFGQTPK
jgi:hypothetical protein